MSSAATANPSSFSVYVPFIRNAFLTMLAYRMRYVTGIITYLLFVSVHYFIWQAVFAGAGPDGRIHGFSFPEMVTYVAVGWISRSLYFSDIDDEIDELHRTGQISIYLLRPVNFQIMMLSQAFGGCLFRASFFTIPLGIVICLVFPVALPASIPALLAFALSTFFAFLVLAELNFMVGLLAFSLKSIQGIVRAKYFLVQFLSGLLLPFSFFPDSIRQVLEVLPFQVITYLPLQSYLGKLDGPEMLRAFAMQIFWVIALYFLGRWWWNRAMAKLTLQGG